MEQRLGCKRGSSPTPSLCPLPSGQTPPQEQQLRTFFKSLNLGTIFPPHSAPLHAPGHVLPPYSHPLLPHPPLHFSPLSPAELGAKGAAELTLPCSSQAQPGEGVWLLLLSSAETGSLEHSTAKAGRSSSRAPPSAPSSAGHSGDKCRGGWGSREERTCPGAWRGGEWGGKIGGSRVVGSVGRKSRRR